jgi:glycosyl transferase family 87
VLRNHVSGCEYLVHIQMRPQLWFLLGLLVGGTTLLYVSRILNPWEDYVDVEHGTLKARLGDLYSPWLGSRELLLHGRNPYSEQVTHEIQMEFYGRVIEQSLDQPGNAIDEQRFAYPVYAVFFVAPIVRLEFQQGQLWALPVLGFLTAASVLLWLGALRWGLSATTAAALILFVLSSPQIVQGLRLRQLGLVVGFLIALAAWCIGRNYLSSAGLLLALSTIKPQMVVLPIACLLIWTLGRWRERWQLFASFLGGMLLLVLLGELALPGWVSYFAAGVRAYWSYGPTKSLLRVLLGPVPAGILSALLICALVASAWRHRKSPGNSREFADILAACFLTEAIALPLISPFNQVLLLLPVLMILKGWEKIPLFLRAAFVFCFSWPPIACLILLLLLKNIHSSSPVPLLPSFLAILVPFLLAPVMASQRRARP